ncbi:MAG: RDD family protein [Defluviitaleaceae bacterium]|nr:RDD family protein [Defluviitaleaceae bacterium]
MSKLINKASVGKRLGAFLIDSFVFSFIFAFAFNFVLFGVQMLSGFNEAATLVFLSISMLIIFLLYGLRDVVKGQSVGKRIFSIGVRDASDNFVVPPASKLFLRQIFSFIWPIEFLVLVFSNENRKIGDKIAGTGVYDLREYENFLHYAKCMEYMKQGQNAVFIHDAEYQFPTARLHKVKKAKVAMIVIGVMLVGAIFIGALVLGITSMFRNHPSYHLATDSIRANPEIVELIGEIESFGFFPTGNLSFGSSHGDANYSIRAIGAYGEVRVFVELQMRDGGDWEIVRFNFVQIR